MESKDVVLLLLAVLGGVVAGSGVVFDSRRRAQARWREQQSVDRMDSVNDFEAGLGDEAAVAKRSQRDERHRIATGRGLDEPEQSLTRTEISGRSAVSPTG